LAAPSRSRNNMAPQYPWQNTNNLR
jgi:hypothetical protein